MALQERTDESEKATESCRYTSTLWTLTCDFREQNHHIIDDDKLMDDGW